MATIRLLFPLLIVLFISSCDRPECKNTNPVFDRFAPDSREYKAELAKQIHSIGPENLRYWFDGYRKQADKEFIVARIQGKGLCATGAILVNDWDKIAALRGPGPRGYHGAALSGLRLDIKEDSCGVTFVFKELDGIID